VNLQSMLACCQLMRDDQGETYSKSPGTMSIPHVQELENREGQAGACDLRWGGEAIFRAVALLPSGRDFFILNLTLKRGRAV